MVFRTQGDVVEYLQAQGLKISKSKLNRDYLAGLLVRGDAKGFLEADVLAYAESLREPARPSPTDALREELAWARRFLRRLLKAIPHAGQLEKTLDTWLADAGENADAATREAAQDALARLRAKHAPRKKPDVAPPPIETTAERAEDGPQEEFRALCLGIVADGIVNASEAHVLARWLAENPQAESYAMQQLQHRLTRIVDSGNFTSRDGIDLCHTLKGLIGCGLPAWLEGSPLPGRPQKYNGRPVRDALMLTPEIPGLYDAVEKIDLGATFCFTGIFAFGDRPDCEAHAAQQGGKVSQRPVKGEPCYLVVGSIASPDWAHGCYGRKIELAMRYRAEGAPLKIIPEDVWAAGFLPPPAHSAPKVP